MDRIYDYAVCALFTGWALLAVGITLKFAGLPVLSIIVNVLSTILTIGAVIVARWAVKRENS